MSKEADGHGLKWGNDTSLKDERCALDQTVEKALADEATRKNTGPRKYRDLSIIAMTAHSWSSIDGPPRVPQFDLPPPLSSRVAGIAS